MKNESSEQEGLNPWIKPLLVLENLRLVTLAAPI